LFWLRLSELWSLVWSFFCGLHLFSSDGGVGYVTSFSVGTCGFPNISVDGDVSSCFIHLYVEGLTIAPQVPDGFFRLSAWSAAVEVWTDHRFHGRRCRFLSSSSLFASRRSMLVQCSGFAFRCGLGNESCDISNGWRRGATWKVDVLGLRRSDAAVGFIGIELCSGGVGGLICIFSFFQDAFCKGLGCVVMLLFHLVNAVTLHKKKSWIALSII
jgi:hypothetical protein